MNTTVELNKLKTIHQEKGKEFVKKQKEIVEIKKQFEANRLAVEKELQAVAKEVMALDGEARQLFTKMLALKAYEAGQVGADFEAVFKDIMQMAEINSIA